VAVALLRDVATGATQTRRQQPTPRLRPVRHRRLITAEHPTARVVLRHRGDVPRVVARLRLAVRQHDHGAVEHGRERLLQCQRVIRSRQHLYHHQDAQQGFHHQGAASAFKDRGDVESATAQPAGRLGQQRRHRQADAGAVGALVGEQVFGNR